MASEVPKVRGAMLLRRTVYVGLLLIPVWTGAVPLEPGAEMPTLRLNDQHDKPAVVGPATQVVIFSAEKPASDLVIKVLGAKPKGALETAGIAYVADISAMPAVIARMFALPKLRELPFTVALAREAGVVTDLPRRAGFATVLHLRGGRVTQVRYAQTEAQLLQALEPIP